MVLPWKLWANKTIPQIRIHDMQANYRPSAPAHFYLGSNIYIRIHVKKLQQSLPDTWQVWHFARRRQEHHDVTWPAYFSASDGDLFQGMPQGYGASKNSKKYPWPPPEHFLFKVPMHSNKEQLLSWLCSIHNNVKYLYRTFSAMTSLTLNLKR